MADGKDWGNPPILWASEGANIFLTATYMAGNVEVHKSHECYPGGVDGVWEETVVQVDHIDAGEPWSDGHNLTLYGLDFPTKNRYRVCGRGVCGETVVEVR